MVNNETFTATGYKKSTKELFSKRLFLVFSILTLSGCLSSGSSLPLAPSPPEYHHFTSTDHGSSEIHMLSEGDNYIPDYAAAVTAVAGSGALVDARPTDQIDGVVQVKSLSSTKIERCSLRDRFDRKVLLAYEWDRSRLSMDVDGVNMNSMGEDMAVRFEFKMRLQRGVKKVRKCRSKSQWQGMIGTGYHELIEREENTVWDEIRFLKKDVVKKIKDVF